MGTICLAEDDCEGAVEMLVDAEQHFQKHLGPKNPLTGEAQLCLAVARAKLLDSGHGVGDPFSRVLAPMRRRDLLRSADAGLAAMQAGYGHEHMLVEKATALHRQLQSQ